MKNIKILGIESSCDESAVAIYDSDRGLLAHTLHTQIAMHQPYGGVVPELASRDHIRKLLPLLAQTLDAANIKPSELDAVAYTAGPGLVGALLVGASIAESVAFAWNIPAMAIHHMEGHLLAAQLETPAPEFPFLALLVSGGHTLLIRVDGIGKYHMLGESIDDAVGEAFDKTAKLMGLPYPGGPELAALAERGHASQFRFARPMLDRDNFDFSFSGLKTQVSHAYQKSDRSKQTCANIAYAFQEAVVETLTVKCQRAILHTGLQRLVIAGGVGANKALRAALNSMMQNLNGQLFFPRTEFCTDNAAMIAYAGYQQFLLGYHKDLSIKVYPRWPMSESST